MAGDDDDDVLFSFSSWDVWHQVAVASPQKEMMSNSPLFSMRPGVRCGALQVSRWRQSLLAAKPCDHFAARSAAVAVMRALDEPKMWSAQHSKEGRESQARNLRHDPLRGCQESSKDCSSELRELQEGGADSEIPPCLGEDAFDIEERSWEQQRRQVGLVGRLVVYKDSTTLREDFVLRPGLRQSGAVVAMVRCPGLAEKAGIQVGDRLVSVNGKRLQDVADCVSMGVVTDVELPAALVFMSKIGKVTSEVRLVSSAPVEMDFTLASDKVWAGARTKFLYQEERVFDPNLASLALGVQAGKSVSPPQMFSLEQQEAAHLVRRAKHDAEAHLRQFHSEECQASTADVGAQSSNRSGLDESDTSQGVEALGDEAASPKRAMGTTASPSPREAWTGPSALAPAPKTLKDDGIEESWEAGISDEEFESRRL
ncbi:Fubp1 [Symbiodinium microadriaticum]|nr:Fubp1 [Symbiodinium microadriaticum]